MSITMNKVRPSNVEIKELKSSSKLSTSGAESDVVTSYPVTSLAVVRRIVC